MSDFQNIERYFLGQMPEQEKRDFLHTLKNNPSLAKKFNAYQAAHDVLDLAVEEDLREMLSEIDKQEENEKLSATRIPIVRKLVIAASVLIVVSAGAWFLLSVNGPSVEQFAEAEYINYRTEAYRGSQDASRLQTGFILMEAGRTDEAILWFSDRVYMHPDDTEAKFILADLYKRAGNTENAKDHLLTIARTSSLLWKEKAQWNYLALSAMDAWNAEADSILQVIMEDKGHSFHDQAETLNDFISR